MRTAKLLICTVTIIFNHKCNGVWFVHCVYHELANPLMCSFNPCSYKQKGCSSLEMAMINLQHKHSYLQNTVVYMYLQTRLSTYFV